MRPRRLYKDKKKNKFYYLVNGKKKFIRIPEGISQKQIVKINIKNIPPSERRRIKKRRVKKIVKYTTDKIAPDLLKSFSFPSSELPITLYSSLARSKPLKIEQVESEDLKKVTLAIEDLIKNLNKAPEIKQQTQLPLPTITDVTDFSETPEQFLGGLAEYPTQIPTKKRLPIEDSKEVKEKAERILKKLKSKETTPVTSITSTPLREEQEDIMFPAYIVEPPTAKDKQIKTKIKELLGRELIGEERDFKKNKTIRGSITNFIKENYPKIEIDKETISRYKNWQKQISKVYDKVYDKKTGLKIYKAGKGKNKEDGLWSDEIEKILKLKIKDIVPVVSIDEVKNLIPYVNNETKRFGFIMNKADSSSDGTGENGNTLGHWTACYINNEDDYQSIEYFDSFGDDPDKSTIESLREMARRINPEKYFKVKINKLKLQPETSPHCGHYSIKFLEDRFNGIPFSQASGYDAYIEKFKPDFSKDFKVKKYDNYL